MFKLNGKSFSTSIGGLPIYVRKFSLEITDDSAVAMRRGKPAGRLLGNVSASGEIEIDGSELSKIIAEARKAGSFQDLPEFDINSFGKAGDVERKVEAFGCALKLSTVLDIDDSVSDETVHTVPFDVTGEEFVHIDGVPYASQQFVA